MYTDKVISTGWCFVVQYAQKNAITNFEAEKKVRAVI